MGSVIGDLDEAAALTLEVHRAVATDYTDLPLLPPYLTRAHDDLLRAELARAEQGSQVVMLIGASSTGKTRACWEAIRAVLPRWRVWQPLTPERPQAVVEALADGRVAPRTVIWLNEAQMYLQPPGVGAQVATALQQLLHAPTGPILVLGSMWPQYWATLTDVRLQEHAAARVLLGRGVDISVPTGFSDADLARLKVQIAADPRLRTAAEHGGRRITQHLAGVPELIRRYEQADDHARAVLWAAMDARRLSRWLYLPRQLLYQAAPGYLDPEIWDQTPDDETWLSEALTYLTEPCHGTPGPLRRHKPLPGDTTLIGDAYRLADYLEQTGRTQRAEIFPPATFWNAVTACADPEILADLADAAHCRGRLRRADQLFRQAADHGSRIALLSLARQWEDAGDRAGVEALYWQAADRGDTLALLALGRMREEVGDRAGAEALYWQAADLGNTWALKDLAQTREHVGDRAGAEALYRQAADLGDISALKDLAQMRERVGDRDGAEAAASQAADRGDTSAMRELCRLRERGGDRAGAEGLYWQAAERGGTWALRDLARMRERAGDPAGAEAVAAEASNRGEVGALRDLAQLREQAGDHGVADRLYRQAVDRGDTGALWDLARMRQQVGDQDAAERLYLQAAHLGDTAALGVLTGLRERSGNPAGAEAAAVLAADRGDTEALRDLAALRDEAGDCHGAEATAALAAERGDTGALRDLAALREERGDRVGAEVLYRQAADRGDSDALIELAELLAEAGDRAGAEALYRQAADAGVSEALSALALLWRRSGDLIGAKRLLRLGLTDDGKPCELDWTGGDNDQSSNR
ncbi:hypothetical protein C1A38_09460 [Verrucosispora sp. ts21]|nr:hypothetical protein C1A38_09460 [Verrucosispora sp. ts21]